MATVWESLARGIKSAIHLKVVTYIGDSMVTGQGASDICEPEIKLPQGDAKAMVTCIDLLQGDIVNCIPAEYAQEEKTWVRTYHSSQVELGQQIVERNLRLVGELGSKLMDLLKDVDETPTAPDAGDE